MKLLSLIAGIAILQPGLAQWWSAWSGPPGFHGISAVESSSPGMPTAPIVTTNAEGSTLTQWWSTWSGPPGFHGITDSSSPATSATTSAEDSRNDAKSTIASDSTSSVQPSLDPSTTLGPSTSEQITSAVETPASTARSTITTVPESFSTEMITGTATSSNSWLTTSKEGQSSSTIVPVIWCPNCGGPVIVWELPIATSVVYSLPGLPEFELPCNPTLSGCSKPPTVEKEKEPEVTDNPENIKRPSSNPEQTTSSASTTSASSSSEESCSGSTTTATDCRVACSAFQSTSDNTATISTTCYTTSCDTTIGCSLQPTTTTSITTTEEPSTCILATGTPYDMKASLEEAGIPLPGWLKYSGLLMLDNTGTKFDWPAEDDDCADCIILETELPPDPTWTWYSSSSTTNPEPTPEPTLEPTLEATAESTSSLSTCHKFLRGHRMC